MSRYWSLYSLDPARFAKEATDPALGVQNLKVLLSDCDAVSADARLLTPGVLDLLGQHDLNYNRLPKKHWRALDAYYRLYATRVLNADPIPGGTVAESTWQHLLRFYRDRNGRDTAVLEALAERGRRHGLEAAPESWLGKVGDLLYNRPADYLVVGGEELDTLCRHLQALFYVNSWDWPNYLAEQHKLRPGCLQPFLDAREKGMAVFSVLTPQVSACHPATEYVPEPLPTCARQSELVPRATSVGVINTAEGPKSHLPNALPPKADENSRKRIKGNKRLPRKGKNSNRSKIG